MQLASSFPVIFKVRQSLVPSCWLPLEFHLFSAKLIPICDHRLLPNHRIETPVDKLEVVHLFVEAQQPIH